MKNRIGKNQMNLTMTQSIFLMKKNNKILIYIIMTDRPIVSKGNYDLNFIDWNNEWERVTDIYEDD